jgi:C4-dicarboxylate transporter DctM subunit
MIILLLIALAIGLLIAGAEIFLIIGIPAVLAKHIFHPGMPDLIIGQRVVGGVEVVTLLAIPFFVFASDLMARGRMAAQLADLFRALVGHYRGGIGHSTVVTCMVFGAAAGSAPATVAAMGRLSFPELKRAGFSEKFSLGLIASSAECALLIPPSITFVVYSWLTGTSIAALFAAGLIIGIVLGLAFMVLVAIEAWRVGAAVGERYSAAARWKAFREAFWALLMQVILLVGIFSGVFTATEAAAVSVVYAIGVEVLIFRAFGWREVFDIAKDSAVSTGVIFILLAMGALLAFFITLSGLDQKVLALVREIGVHWVVFMLIVNIVFLTCAMFLDPNSIMVIFLPTLFPIAAALGIDPVHFGMVVTLNVCTGMITPPLGLDLAVAASTLNRPMEAVVAGIWPFIVTNVVVLILISYIPPLSTFLPKIFGV